MWHLERVWKQLPIVFSDFCHSDSCTGPFYTNILTCQCHICDSYRRLPDYRFIFRQLVRSPVHGSKDNWVLPIILMHHMWWGRGWFCLCPFCKIVRINMHTTVVIMKMLCVLLHDSNSSKHTEERWEWRGWWRGSEFMYVRPNFHIRWMREEINNNAWRQHYIYFMKLLKSAQPTLEPHRPQ